MAIAYNRALIIGAGRRIIRARCRAGRNGLPRMPALIIDTSIA
jgi:hypothetical protein